MKILHLNSYYIRSGLYTNLYDLQVKSNIDIRVFVPALINYEKLDYKIGDYADVVPDFTSFDRLMFHVKNMKMYRDANSLYKDFDCDLVHSHTLFTNGYMALKMKKDYGRKYIVAVRDTDVNDFFKKQIWLRGLGNKILYEAEKVIFISKPYKDHVLSTYVKHKYRSEIENKSIVIPNGIESFWIDNKRKMPKTYEIDSNKIRIICVGTIYKRKNIEYVVKAAKVLISRGYEIELRIIGPVRDNAIYEEIIKEPFVEYVPRQTKEELVKYYDESDVFILPSITETFGLVYAEALSQGLPVIYTRGQGFDEQFPDGFVGFAVNCFDEIEIADKTLKILDNYTEISQNCINSCSKFDWKSICEQYTDIYRSLK